MNDSAKTYVLGMFPYPSGEGLHVGHVRIYTAVDVMARYFRMTGDEVMSPTGWDAFGLPAENAAIKARVNPAMIVPKNYANFRAQMKNLDLNFDWDRELATTDPAYYGITQWIFLELYKKGLVYREQVPINWCPKCKTGLANEEVLGDGTHERCGEMTGKKELPQWVMRITDYADRLLQDLDKPVAQLAQCSSSSVGNKNCKIAKLENGDTSMRSMDWPRGILEMQRNWIGKKEGVRVQFAVNSEQLPGIEILETFTTRIDTIMGVTYVVISPEMARDWISKCWEASVDVREYVESSLQKSEQTRLAEAKEKTGVKTDLMVVNPANGEEVNVWVADYVLSSVGTGAVMGVPSLDARDREFAEKYGIEIREIELENTEAIFDKLSKAGVVEKETSWHLRDWVFSRQRYWGEPIPLVYCAECAKTGANSKLQIVKQNGKKYAVVPLKESDLPLTLPDLESYEPTETGESPLARVDEWVSTTCPSCGGEARRETDTMPNWAGSCWYHLAFSFWKSSACQRVSVSVSQKDTKTILKEYKAKSETPFSDFWQEVARPAIDKWLPVDWYLGGAEHAVLHLLYARFWNKVLHDLGHVGFSEPYLRLRSVGMVLAEDGRKMSKSWGNVINPDDMVKKHGSDAVRLYEMFMGPWDQAIAWDERALIGMKRFLSRVEKTVEGTDPARMVLAGEGETSPELARALAKLIEKVGKGIVEQKFNTSIAGMMELVNLWRNGDLVMSEEDAQKFAQILSPFAPKIAQIVWEKSGGEGKVEESAWPVMSFDSLTLAQDLRVTIAVQVMGKLRATVEVSSEVAESEEEVMKVVMEDEKVQKWIPESGIKKTIYVKGRLVSLVV